MALGLARSISCVGGIDVSADYEVLALSHYLVGEFKESAVEVHLVLQPLRRRPPIGEIDVEQSKPA